MPIKKYVRLKKRPGGKEIEEEYGGKQPLNMYTVTPKDVLSWPGHAASHGTATGDPSGEILYTAVNSGIGGNAIAIISDVQIDTPILTVEVIDTTITLHLKVSSEGGILSTFGEIADAINNDPIASLLVGAEVINSAGSTYNAGDVYLTDGDSIGTLDTLLKNEVIWGARTFFPIAWDATTIFSFPQLSFIDGDSPDPSTEDATSENFTTADSQPVFDQAYMMRVPSGSADLTVIATCESGAIPTEGKMILMVDIRKPA